MTLNRKNKTIYSLLKKKKNRKVYRGVPIIRLNDNKIMISDCFINISPY